MSTLSSDQQKAIADLLARTSLCVGLGSGEKNGKITACSLAAINLALTGKLTDRIPDCMSLVIGRWIVRIQDRMPNEIRNSPEWRQLLPLAAGTGRDHEGKRRDLILSWMWDRLGDEAVLKAVSASARTAWDAMTAERTSAAARRARDSVRAAYADAYAAGAAYAAYAAATAAYASDAASDASDAAADAASAAYAAGAASAAYAAYVDGNDYWRRADPVGLLRALVAVSAEEGE